MISLLNPDTPLFQSIMQTVQHHVVVYGGMQEQLASAALVCPL